MRVVTVYDDEREKIITYVRGQKANQVQMK